MLIEPYEIALATPMRTARGTIRTRRGFVVRLSEPAGVGEAAPLPGWTESVADCRNALKRCCEDDPDPVAALDRLSAAATPAARHGLSLAVADARARAMGQPLYRWLGGTDDRPVPVPVNATIGGGSTGETVARAEAAVEAGYRAVKLKLGTGAVEREIDRIAAVRRAVPDAVSVRGDANGAWSVAEATRVFEALDGTGVSYVEQPLSADKLDAHRRLRGAGDVGVVLDETIRAMGPRATVESGAADGVVLKPMVVGGPRRARSIARRAQTAGLTPVVTTTVDAAVARLGAIHVAASLSLTTACGLATATRLAADIAPDPAPVSGGTVTPPSDPGHGVTVEQ